MLITGSESFILKVPIENEVADSKRSVSYLEFVGLRIDTDAGISGTGYTITVGHGAATIQSALDTLLRDDLPGEDPHNVRAIWDRLYFGKALWIGRAGAVIMAQAAVDIALWDIIAKAAGRPLWQVLGGATPGPLETYNTHSGWLNYSIAQLRDEARQQIDAGYKVLKMKVGGPDLSEDIRRVEAVRHAIGDDIRLMADANQNWDGIRAAEAVRRLAPFNLGWIEEPLHPDDISGHARLKKQCPMPLALGEHVYSTHIFREFIEREAVDVVQVDVCRIGGITPWLEVAALANAAGLKVCPHAGDLMQVHQHLVRAIPNRWYLEVIPLWERGPFANQIVLQGGLCLPPCEPGASSDFSDDAFSRFRVS